MSNIRTDNFNRSNDTQLGTPSDAGSNWIDLNSAGHISSNRAIGNPAMSTGVYRPVALESVSTIGNTVTIKATITQVGATSGIIFDYDDTLGAGLETYSGVLFGSDWPDNTAYVVRVENGSLIFNITTYDPVVDGDEVSIVPDSSGGSGRVYINGSLAAFYPMVNLGSTKQGLVLSNDSIIENFSTSNDSFFSSSINLYTYGGYVGRESLMLYIGGMGLPCEGSLPLVCWNQTVVGPFFPLLIIGEGTELGASVVNETLLLFINAPFGASLPLYMLGGPQPSADSELPLYISGAGQTTGSLPLSIPNVHGVTIDSLNLYIHGF